MDSLGVDQEYGISRAPLFHQENHDESQVVDLRKGPWTAEEDSLLFNYVSAHGDGRWNSLARHAGLKRTGKSCRLRWLNYLRPSVRRGNITLQEQLLILELHARWGNRWSKIAQYLPGRTDNEIKNYWRTRVQKQAKQLKCDVNSKQFKEAMRHVWIPRLVERIQSTRPVFPAQPIPTPLAHSSPDTSDTQLTDCFDPSGSGLEVSDYYDDADVFMSGGDAANGGDHSFENWWSDEDLSFFQQHLLD